MTSDLQIKNPQVNVVDRPRQGLRRSASRAEQIENALYNAYGTRRISTIYAPNNQYKVILELRRALPARSRRAVAALRALVERAAGAARRRGDARARASAR